MKKLKAKHCYVLNSCQKLLENARSNAIEPKFIKALDRDIRLIAEVTEMLWFAIENPVLPFVPSQPPSVAPVLDPIEQEPNAAF
jgi:hypothetical protein